MSQSRNEAGSPWSRMLPVMALVLIAGVILGVTFSRSERSRAPSPTQEISRGPATVLSPAPPVPASGTSGAAAAPQVSGGDEEQMWNAAQIDAEREARNQHQVFASRYSGERVDAHWAGPKEAKMLAASKSDQITQLHAEPQNLDIDCKATMCRIQADFAKRSSAQDWFTLFSLNGSDIPKASYEYTLNPDGGWRVTVYGVLRK